MIDDASMNPDTIMGYVGSRAWVPLGALIVGGVLRLFKDDTILPTIPAKWRLVIVLALSFGLIVLNKMAVGMTWRQAIEYAIISAVLAVASHELVIERLRGGKEIPLPLLMKKPAQETPVVNSVDVPPPPPSPPS